MQHWYPGRSLLEWFAPGDRPTPRELGVLLDHLPRQAHLRSVMSRDVEVYERSGAADRPPLKALPPDLTEFGPTEELLAAVFDRLGEVVRALAALGGSKRRMQLKPWTRPVTAADLVRQSRMRRNFLHLEEVITRVPAAEWRDNGTYTPLRR